MIINLFHKTPRRCHYKRGDRIRHCMLLDGTVTKIIRDVRSPNHLGDRVEIRFDHGGVKELVWGFCRGRMRKIGKKP